MIPWSTPGNKPIKGFWHWSAGDYEQRFPDYTYLVIGDAAGTVVMNYSDLSIPVYATWHENSGSVDIAAMCMAGGELFGQWPVPPLPLQVERMCYLAASESHRHGFPVSCWKTHCEIAVVDGYGPDSGDPNLRYDFIALSQLDQHLRNGGELMRERTQWYLDKHFGGK